jgi:hypothetical protein
MYWTDFSSSLPTEQKKDELLLEKGLLDANQCNRDDADYIFSDLEFAPAKTVGDVSGLVSKHWRGLSLPCRDAWKARSHVTINTLPILGRLPASMPRRINNQ